jgi:hypothetical protein
VVLALDSAGDGRVWLRTRDPIVFQHVGDNGGEGQSGDDGPSVSDVI